MFAMYTTITTLRILEDPSYTGKQLTYTPTVMNRFCFRFKSQDNNLEICWENPAITLTLIDLTLDYKVLYYLLYNLIQLSQNFCHFLYNLMHIIKSTSLFSNLRKSLLGTLRQFRITWAKDFRSINHQVWLRSEGV